MLFFVVDGFNSFISFFPGAPVLYQPQNGLRLLAGSGMGIAIAVALFPAFNQTVWVDWDPKPAMPGLRSLGGLVLLMLLVDLLVLSENPLLLYPLALISAAGVLLLLTLAYSMVWLMIFRAENRFLKRTAAALAPRWRFWPGAGSDHPARPGSICSNRHLGRFPPGVREHRKNGSG